MEKCVYPELSKAIINDKFATSNELLFGGNFISTPPNPHIQNDLGVILTVDSLNEQKNIELDTLIKFIQSNLNDNQKIIKINCSFPHINGGIHIDEILCPMPYKLYDVFPGYTMNFKIWIYKIQKIEFNTEKLNNELINFFKRDPRTHVNNIGEILENYNNSELLDLAEKLTNCEKEYNKIPIGKRDDKLKFKQSTNITDKKMNIFSYENLMKYNKFFDSVQNPNYEKNYQFTFSNAISLLCRSQFCSSWD